MRQVLFIILLLLFGLSERSLALRWDGPKATGLIDLGGVSGPEPTTPPDLAKRQDVAIPSLQGQLVTSIPSARMIIPRRCPIRIL